MAHWIEDGFKPGLIQNVKRSAFKIADRNGEDEVIWEDRDRGIAKVKEAAAKDVLMLIVTAYPQQVLTRQDSIHSNRLYDQIWESEKEVKRRGLTHIVVEDAEWDWVVKALENDKVGPVIFGVHLKRVEDGLKELEKRGEEKRKGASTQEDSPDKADKANKSEG